MKTIFNVEKICGINVGEYSLESIQNNPNFIFENDPNYETVVLYSSEGAVINVNSWIECAHYVNGGWEPFKTTIFDIGAIILYIAIGTFSVFKIFSSLRAFSQFFGEKFLFLRYS